MKGVCIDADISAELTLGQGYYLFPAQPNHFYVSRFNRIRSNFGCYQAERFRVMEEWQKEPNRRTLELDRNHYYTANLIWRPIGYRNKTLKGYVIKSSKTHCYFWHDKERKRFAGCFPLHWFRDFKSMTEQPSSQVIEGQPIALLERPDGQLTFF